MTVDKLNLAWSWKPRKVERKSVSSGSICRERRDTSIRVQSSSAEQSTGKHSQAQRHGSKRWRARNKKR